MYHNKCWQQCADIIQERYEVYTRRRLVNQITGELKSGTDYTKLSITAATADIAFLHRAPLDDANTTRPDAAVDILVHFYPQLITHVNALTLDVDKLRCATETIDQLRRSARGAIWELWTDGAVRERTGAGAAQLYIGRDEQPKWTGCAPAGNCTDLEVSLRYLSERCQESIISVDPGSLWSSKERESGRCGKASPEPIR